MHFCSWEVCRCENPVQKGRYQIRVVQREVESESRTPVASVVGRPRVASTQGQRNVGAPPAAPTGREKGSRGRDEEAAQILAARLDSLRGKIRTRNRIANGELH